MRLPKPLHGWRVFLGEVAVIVLGVLIAIGAEQLAQAYDWRQRVGHGRTLLRAEVEQAATSAQDRIDFGDCSNKRLDMVDALIMETATNPTEPMLRTRYYTIIRTWSQSVWDTMTNSGLAEHFPETEMLAYADMHASIAMIKEGLTAEQDSISDLAVMTRLKGRLDDNMRGRLLLASTRARRLNNTIVRDSRQLIEAAAVLHIFPSREPMTPASAALYRGCPSLLTHIPGVPQ